METVTRGDIEMSWHPEARLAVLRFAREVHGVGEDARFLIAALTKWVGDSGQLFALLGDGARLAGVDADYRSHWGTFLRAHRSEALIAFFNMGPIIRVAAEMFRIGTGLQLKAFVDEASARAWLRGKGIAA